MTGNERSLISVAFKYFMIGGGFLTTKDVSEDEDEDEDEEDGAGGGAGGKLLLLLLLMLLLLMVVVLVSEGKGCDFVFDRRNNFSNRALHNGHWFVTSLHFKIHSKQNI